MEHPYFYGLIVFTVLWAAADVLRAKAGKPPLDAVWLGFGDHRPYDLLTWSVYLAMRYGSFLLLLMAVKICDAMIYWAGVGIMAAGRLILLLIPYAGA